jgi:hypothetical protein
VSRFSLRLRQAGGNSRAEGTIFGYNTSNTDPERIDKVNWWGRVPCGRTYYGNSALPSSGSGFNSGGKEYKCAGLDVAGAVSSRRINVCFNIDAANVTSSSSPRAVEAYDYVRSIPAGGCCGSAGTRGQTGASRAAPSFPAASHTRLATSSRA